MLARLFNLASSYECNGAVLAIGIAIRATVDQIETFAFDQVIARTTVEPTFSRQRIVSCPAIDCCQVIVATDEVVSAFPLDSCLSARRAITESMRNRIP